MSFVTEEELRGMYQTEGAFYQRELQGVQYTCRSLAKISRQGLDSNRADAIFVMLNPGSCQPADDSYVYPHHTNNLMEIPMVRAKSDKTQYQIMRLMERLNWHVTYIVNLSDLRAGNITQFKKHLIQFELQNDESHSIFSKERFSELDQFIDQEMKVIAAWGTQKFMKKRMLEALSLLSESGEVCGVPHLKHPFYYHPFPMLQHKCIKWVEDGCAQFKETV